MVCVACGAVYVESGKMGAVVDGIQAEVDGIQAEVDGIHGEVEAHVVNNVDLRTNEDEVVVEVGVKMGEAEDEMEDGKNDEKDGSGFQEA